ncbi:MAG: Fe-Mn family superoxide dismutase [Porticoccus sp.]|nr:Fe-Mn family superoxide dismutase [Porticoccus sp.]
MSSEGGGAPTGALDEAIISQFDSLESFQKAFSDGAVANIASGWTWLVKNIADGDQPSTTGQHWQTEKYEEQTKHAHRPALKVRGFVLQITHRRNPAG